MKGGTDINPIIKIRKKQIDCWTTLSYRDIVIYTETVISDNKIVGYDIMNAQKCKEEAILVNFLEWDIW